MFFLLFFFLQEMRLVLTNHPLLLFSSALGPHLPPGSELEFPHRSMGPRARGTLTHPFLQRRSPRHRRPDGGTELGGGARQFGPTLGTTVGK